MAALIKVSMLPSIWSKKHPQVHHLMMNKWVAPRMISNSGRRTTAAESASMMMEVGVMARPKGSVAIGSSNSGGDKAGERFSVGWREEGWKLLSCAHFGHAFFPNLRLRRNFGQKPSSFCSSSSSSSGSTTTTQGGPVADMGSENKDDDQPDNDPLPSLQLNHHHLPCQQQQQQQQQPPRLLTLPTILTLGRVAAVPILICTFYMNGSWGTTATTGIFIVAAITDWLDGYIARKMRLGTAFGAFLDPVADKLMVAATLVLLCTRPFEVAMFGEVPWLLTVPSIAIIGREITMSAVREWAASQNSKVLEAVAVNNLGKWKTATQMTALTVLLATRDSSLTGSGILVASGVILLYISAGLAVWSLAVYMRKIWRMLPK